MTGNTSFRIVVAAALFSGISVPAITAGFVGATLGPVIADQSWQAPPADPAPLSQIAADLPSVARTRV